METATDGQVGDHSPHSCLREKKECRVTGKPFLDMFAVADIGEKKLHQALKPSKVYLESQNDVEAGRYIATYFVLLELLLRGAFEADHHWDEFSGHKDCPQHDFHLSLRSRCLFSPVSSAIHVKQDSDYFLLDGRLRREISPCDFHAVVS